MSAAGQISDAEYIERCAEFMAWFRKLVAERDLAIQDGRDRNESRRQE